jgi:glucosamine kinase
MVRNYDFQHYAPAAARYLAYEVMHQLLAVMVFPADAPFVDEVLAYWGVADVSSLRELGVHGFCADDLERKRRFGDMAPIVTAAAQRGIPLACRVCDRAAETLSIGIRLVGNCFERGTVRVAVIGGVAQDVYIRNELVRALDRSEERRYVMVKPELSNAAGAILLALRNCGVFADDSVLANLRTSDPQHLDTLLQG